MRKTLALALLLFAPALFANTIQFSSPEKSNVVVALKDLESLPQTTYITELPWLEAPTEFDGVKLSTLLQHAFGDIPQNVEVRALNDYHSDLSREDILRYQPIVAYKQNHNYIKIRNKGPYWLIYSMSEYPELDNAQYHSQMVWQINRISAKEEQ
ncbi:oxidoreductase [Vibrio hyugaensis]|uniref:Oxidoreductase n=1 Tax=Vibrio hyugaensis TaxID=1534743 RepID=A0ABQ5Y7E8_9VIBR|nr:oxidoreductase [Vibrio hyugaensis]GLR06907.1 oxidoreductase [Vibrio hyugaensis]